MELSSQSQAPVPRRGQILFYLPAVIVVLLGLAGTLAAWQDARREVQHELSQQLDRHADDIQIRISNRMQTYANALVQVRGLLRMVPDLSQADLSSYIKGIDLLRRYPGIRGMGIARRVEAEDLAAHVAAERGKDGFADYTVRPEYPRAVYFPIVRLVPRDMHNQRAFGYDMFTETIRHDAMARARDDGEPQLSGPVKLVQDQTTAVIPPGFLLYAPIYTTVDIPETVEARRKGLTGFVYAPFRAVDFFNGVFASFGGDRDVSFGVYDGSEVKSDALLYDRAQSLGHEPTPSSLGGKKRTFEVEGRPWTIVLQPTAALHQGLPRNTPGLVLVGGILVSLLIGAVLMSYTHSARRERRARRAAEASAGRARLLARAGDMLTSSTDYRRTLTTVARLATQDVADWCMVHMAEDDTALQLAAVAGPNASQESSWGAISRSLTGSPRTRFGPRHVFNTGEAELYPVLTSRQLMVSVTDETQRAELARLGFRSGLCVPIEARTRRIGTITFVRTRPGRRLGPDDLTLARELGRRIAMAADNARLIAEANASQALKSMILDTALDAVIAIDRHGHVIDWNRGAERIFGFMKEAVLGRELGSLIVPEEFRVAHRRGIEKTVADGSGPLLGKRVELMGLRADGAQLPVELSIEQGLVDGQPVFTAYARDITDRRRVEAELRHAKEQAETANEAKSAFLANMSHEIRTPLGAILGFAELLKEPGTVGLERTTFIDTILRNGKALEHLIDDILDLSKVEAGKLDVEQLRVSLSDLLADIAISLGVRAREKGIDLTFSRAPDVPDFVLTDPTRLRQILLNVIGNALKFTDAGQVSVRVTRLNDPPRLGFEVQDTGRGIEAKARPRLFQPFSQADASTTRRYGGTGLGLALSRTLARALGGDLELAASELGQGSTFVVTVALTPAPADAAAPVVTRPRPVVKARILAGLHVLLAEDAPDNQFLIRRLLTANGAEVDVVDNGRSAVEQALSQSYDVVLMDIQMPRLDGVGATRELRQRGFSSPIIALTAHAMREERERSLKAGCDDHLTKPIDHRRLVETVARYASERRFSQ